MRDKTLVAVVFIKKNAPYNVGEIAGFPPAISERFVKAKRAKYYVPPEEKADPPPAENVEPPPEVKPKPKAKAKTKKKK